MHVCVGSTQVTDTLGKSWAGPCWMKCGSGIPDTHQHCWAMIACCPMCHVHTTHVWVQAVEGTEWVISHGTLREGPHAGQVHPGEDLRAAQHAWPGSSCSVAGASLAFFSTQHARCSLVAASASVIKWRGPCSELVNSLPCCSASGQQPVFLLQSLSITGACTCKGH